MMAWRLRKENLHGLVCFLEQHFKDLKLDKFENEMPYLGMLLQRVCVLFQPLERKYRISRGPGLAFMSRAARAF
jgi:hypothetical protein